MSCLQSGEYRLLCDCMQCNLAHTDCTLPPIIHTHTHKRQQVEAGTTGGDGAAMAQTLELIPDGDSVALTEGNRGKYVTALVSTRLA